MSAQPQYDAYGSDDGSEDDTTEDDKTMQATQIAYDDATPEIPLGECPIAGAKKGQKRAWEASRSGLINMLKEWVSVAEQQSMDDAVSAEKLQRVALEAEEDLPVFLSNLSHLKRCHDGLRSPPGQRMRVTNDER